MGFSQRPNPFLKDIRFSRFLGICDYVIKNKNLIRKVMMGKGAQELMTCLILKGFVFTQLVACRIEKKHSLQLITKKRVRFCQLFGFLGDAVKVLFLCDMTSCHRVISSRRFETTYRIYIQLVNCRIPHSSRLILLTDSVCGYRMLAKLHCDLSEVYASCQQLLALSYYNFK